MDANEAKAKKEAELIAWKADNERVKQEAMASIASMTEQIQALVQQCKDLAFQHKLEFSLDLLDTNDYLTHEEARSRWNDSGCSDY